MRISNLTVVLYFLSSSWLAGESFKGSGQIVDLMQGVSKVTNTFLVLRDQCRLKIVIASLDENDMIERREYVTDGVESYNLMIPKKHFSKTSLFYDSVTKTAYETNMPSEAVTEGSVIINASLIPEFDLALTSVWLAYGAACHIRKSGVDMAGAPVFPLGDDRIADVWLRDATANSIQTLSTWSLTGTVPPYLQSLIEYQPKQWYKYDKAKGLMNIAWPRTADRAHVTNATYQVEDWMDYEGGKIPRRFVVRKYWPRLGSDGILGLQLQSDCHAILDEIGSLGGEEIIPVKIEEKTRVVDHRLAHDKIPVPAIAYSTTNGRVLEPNEVRQLPTYRQHISQIQPVVPWGRRIIVYAAIAATLLTPVGCWMLIKNKNTKTQNESK